MLLSSYQSPPSGSCTKSGMAELSNVLPLYSMVLHAFTAWETMEKLAVFGATVNWTRSPTLWTPSSCFDEAPSALGWTLFTQPDGGVAGPTSPPATSVGAGQEMPGWPFAHPPSMQ